MGEEEKNDSDNRGAVRIHDSFPIKYNIITQKEYDSNIPDVFYFHNLFSFSLIG